MARNMILASLLCIVAASAIQADECGSDGAACGEKDAVALLQHGVRSPQSEDKSVDMMERVGETVSDLAGDVDEDHRFESADEEIIRKSDEEAQEDEDDEDEKEDEVDNDQLEEAGEAKNVDMMERIGETVSDLAGDVDEDHRFESADEEIIRKSDEEAQEDEDDEDEKEDEVDNDQSLEAGEAKNVDMMERIGETVSDLAGDIDEDHRFESADEEIIRKSDEEAQEIADDDDEKEDEVEDGVAFLQTVIRSPLTAPAKEEQAAAPIKDSRVDMLERAGAAVGGLADDADDADDVEDDHRFESADEEIERKSYEDAEQDEEDDTDGEIP